MAAPTDADIKYYGGTDGAPTDDDSAYGGTISTGSELDQSQDNIVIGSETVQETDVTVYGAFYRKNVSSGSLTNARVYNRAGMQQNSSAGPVQVISTSTSDTAIKIKITGLVGAVVTDETWVLTGQSYITTANNFDTNGMLLCEVLSSGGSPTTSVGNLTVSVNGQIVGVIYGTADQAVSGVPASTMITSVYQMAVATSKGTTIGNTSRTLAPDNVGTFSAATKWTGNDQSIPIPTNTLGSNQYIGVCQKMTLPANCPIPVAGYFLFMGVIIGNAIS